MIYCFVVCCVNFVSYLIEASVIPQKDFSSQAIQSYQHSCVNKELWQHEDKGEDFFRLLTHKYSEWFSMFVPLSNPSEGAVNLGQDAMKAFLRPMINTLAARTLHEETALYKILCFMHEPDPLQYKELKQFLQKWTVLNYVASASVRMLQLKLLIRQYAPECTLKEELLQTIGTQQTVVNSFQTIQARDVFIAPIIAMIQAHPLYLEHCTRFEAIVLKAQSMMYGKYISPKDLINIMETATALSLTSDELLSDELLSDKPLSAELLCRLIKKCGNNTKRLLDIEQALDQRFAENYELFEQYIFPDAMLSVITWIEDHCKLHMRHHWFRNLQEARTHPSKEIVVDRAQLAAEELIKYEALTSLFIKALYPATLDKYGIKNFLECTLEKCQPSFIIQLENEGILRIVNGKYQLCITETSIVTQVADNPST